MDKFIKKEPRDHSLHIVKSSEISRVLASFIKVLNPGFSRGISPSPRCQKKDLAQAHLDLQNAQGFNQVFLSHVQLKGSPNSAVKLQKIAVPAN